MLLGYLSMDYFRKTLILLSRKYKKLLKKSITFFFSYKKFLKILLKLMSLGHSWIFSLINNDSWHQMHIYSSKRTCILSKSPSGICSSLWRQELAYNLCFCNLTPTTPLFFFFFGLLVLLSIIIDICGFKLQLCHGITYSLSPLRVHLVGKREKWGIENSRRIEKRDNKKDLIFMCLVGGMKKWNDEKLFCLVNEKSERIENVVYINLLLYPYYIIGKK